MDPCDSAISQDDLEDILSASLQTLYDFSPITFSTAGSAFTYPIDPRRVPIGHPLSTPQQIQLATPDTNPSNWSLHASSIWVSALFIADHIEELQIGAGVGVGEAGTSPRLVHVLELGAGAGLPSILLGHMYPHVRVTATDYPDARLMRTLSDNVRWNSVSERCRAVPYAWGTDVAPLVRPAWADSAVDQNRTDDANHDPQDARRFDIVLAADTLWNPELHAPFLDTLVACLARGPDARVHLVAGLHTGRYTIRAFLDGAMRRGFALDSAVEREVGGAQSRPWDVSRAEGEDERERRRWVVWMILKWEIWAAH